MTKPVTVVAALILYERGYFLLDDPITELWPELGDIQYYVSGEGEDMVTARADPAPTVRQLMMHTAGYFYPFGAHPLHQELRKNPFPENGVSISNVALQIASHPLLFKPGERWNYGFSLDILAGLVEYLAKEPFDKFVQREILDPLDMKDTGYYIPPEKAGRLMDNFNFDDNGRLTVVEKASDSSQLKKDPVTWGGTGLIGPIADYWRFCRMLLQKGTYQGARILSPLSVEYMLMNHIPEEELPYEPEGTPFYRFSKGYGFGLGVKVMVSPSESQNLGSKGESSWSGAASTYFWVVPEHDLAILFFTQNLGYLRVQPTMESIRIAVYQSLLSD
jgi:CubicO group peptidase (beta-lactamase class C family)